MGHEAQLDGAELMDALSKVINSVAVLAITFQKHPLGASWIFKLASVIAATVLGLFGLKLVF